MEKGIGEESLWLVRYSFSDELVDLAQSDPPFEHAIFRAWNEAQARQKLCGWSRHNARPQAIIHSAELLPPHGLKPLSARQARKARQLYSIQKRAKTPAPALV